MALTISEINAVNLHAYATTAQAYKQCVTQLQSLAGEFHTQVARPLASTSTWDCDLSTNGARVAHIHASTAHHAIDSLELAYVTLDHLAADLGTARKTLTTIIEDLVNAGITVADDGTVTLPVDPSTISDPRQRAVAEYEDTDYSNFEFSPYTTPDVAQALVRNAMASFVQIDANAAKVIDTVVAAAGSIVVDTSDVALRSNVDASPKGIDALLALYGDPLKDVAGNAEADPGELEQLKKQVEGLNLTRELTVTEMNDLSRVFKNSTDQQLNRLGDLLADHPGSEQLQEFLEKEGARGFVGVSLLLNYLDYRASVPPSAAVVESIVTVGVSTLTGTVAAGVTTAAAVDALGGGPEDPLADAAGVVAGFFAAGAAAKAQSEAWAEVNKTLYAKGQDGASLDAPDPLTLGPGAIDSASGR